MKKKTLFLLCAVAVVFLSTQAYADVEYKFWAMEDSYITERYATSNYGTSATMRVRDKQTTTSNLFSRALIKFNDADLAQLSGLEILSASVHLFECGRDAATSSEDRVNLFRVTEDWAEGTVNWDNQPGYAVELSRSRLFDADDPTPGWRKWDNLETLASSWVTGTADNYGIMLENDLDGLYNEMNVRFRSTEYLTADGDRGIYRPYLKITATPEPFSAVLFGLGSCLFGAYAIRKKKLI